MKVFEPIFHIAEEDAWYEEGDTYAPATYLDEGFIHCAMAGQLPGVARRFYEGRAGLFLLTIDAGTLGAELVYEDLYEMGEEFPHIYGRLPREAVINARPFAGPAPA